MGNWPSISLVLRTISPALKMAWLRCRATETVLDPVGGDDPAQLAQRLGRDVRLELAADRRLQLGALDREAVGIGGDHGHLRAAGADQDPGQDRAHVVARGGAGDQVHRRGERRGRNRERLALFLREGGEVLAGKDAEVKARAAAADLDVALALAQLDLDRRVAERAGDLGQEAAGEEHRAAAVGFGFELRLHAHLEIGRAETDAVAVGVEEDARRAIGSRRASRRLGRQPRALRRARLVWLSASSDRCLLELD